MQYFKKIKGSALNLARQGLQLLSNNNPQQISDASSSKLYSDLSIDEKKIEFLKLIQNIINIKKRKIYGAAFSRATEKTNSLLSPAAYLFY